MNKMTIDEKMTKINNDRMLLLDMIKKNITNNSANIDSNIALALEVIEYDNKNIKKYNAVLNAQALITDLTNQIVNATTVEEIESIRKKLNYYINMIKKEFIKRGINENELEILKNNTNHLRKGISSYIRFIKREKNIQEIALYNSSLDTLNDEDKQKFKRLLTNELRYNKRNLCGESTSKKHIAKTDSSTIEEDTKKEEKTSNDRDEAYNYFVKMMNSNLTSNENSSSDDETLKSKFIDSVINGVKKAPAKTQLNIKINKDSNADYDYAIDRIKSLQNRYGIIPPIKYKKASLDNVIIFFRNIPRYLINKKAIKSMKNDSRVYYAGSDLFGYIQYLKKSNSILRSFRQLFSKSYLYSRENVYLNNHNKCVEWITNYFNGDAFGLDVKTRSL